MKLAAVHGITRCPFLQTLNVKRQLQKLMTLKSIATNKYVMDRFQEALNTIDTAAHGSLGHNTSGPKT